MTPILLSTTFQDAMNGELLSAPTKLAKALEIDMWLQTHASKEARYIIIDDEYIHLGEKDYIHMIKTDNQTGLSIYEVSHAILTLNGKHKEMTGEY